MPQSIGSPNPQNGSNNPYNPNTYGYTGVGAGQTYSIGGSGYGTITANPLGAIGKSDLDKYLISSSPRQVMELSWVNDDLQFTFTGEENNTVVKMVLAPESDMKPVELFMLNALIQACVNSISSCEAVMRYVRKHNLERHFKFSVA